MVIIVLCVELMSPAKIISVDDFFEKILSIQN
jgi:hypothetical protein